METGKGIVFQVVIDERQEKEEGQDISEHREEGAIVVF
jgi:hypothetical protein